MTERDDLQDWFDAARSEREAPPALMARVLADAEALTDAREAAARPAVSAPVRGNRLRQIFATIGGWPAAASLAVATVAGIGIGAADVLTIDAMGFGNGTYEADLMSSGYADLSWSDG